MRSCRAHRSRLDAQGFGHYRIHLFLFRITLDLCPFGADGNPPFRFIPKTGFHPDHPLRHSSIDPQAIQSRSYPFRRVRLQNISCPNEPNPLFTRSLSLCESLFRFTQ